MRYKIIIVIILILAAIGFTVFKLSVPRNSSQDEAGSVIKPILGSISSTFSSTGSVLPKNRLEIKPPVNGRIDEILVKEGEKVKVGTILGWMSSTERAALLDAARGQDKKTLDYWQEVYKPIALISPISGEVIVATTQPGQTVTASDAVIVLSDQLIVRAQVDETDISKVKLNQNVLITLDAYPEVKIEGKVNHIYYESKTVNNVTVYEVDLLPEEVPEMLRSGMNATVSFVVENKENILLVANEAILKEKDGDYCLLKSNVSDIPSKILIKTGISDEKNTEILSGLTVEDNIILKAKKYSLPKSNLQNNPFMPSRSRTRQGTK
jgi:membrane fusion protein, macrolide-specific efflux system